MHESQCGVEQFALVAKLAVLIEDIKLEVPVFAYFMDIKFPAITKFRYFA